MYTKKGNDFNDDEDDDDDDAWAHINSRLSLPLDHHWRHHHRSPSGAGATTPGGGGGGNGGEYLMMRSATGLMSKEEGGSPEHGNKRGREFREKDGGARSGSGPATTISSNSSRARTPTKMLPPLTMVNEASGSYFPQAVSTRVEKKLV